MTDLIQELKADHAKLASLLGKMRSLSPESKECQDLLRSAKAGLLAHLGKEDAKLYPALKAAAQKDAQIKSTLEMFSTEMEKVSKAALEFFAKYEKGGSGLQFAKDFGGLLATLSTRIRREEEMLYPLYEKIAPARSKAA